MSSSSGVPSPTSTTDDGTTRSQEFGQLSRIIRQLATTLATNFMTNMNATPATFQNFISRISDNITSTLKDAMNSDLLDNSFLNESFIDFDSNRNESFYAQVTPSAFIMDSALNEEW